MIVINNAICGPTIIIARETGVKYTNQVNGCSCSYREIEGFIYPIGKSVTDDTFFFNREWWYDQYGFSKKSIYKLLSSKDKKESYTTQEIEHILREGSANGHWNQDLRNWDYWGEFVQYLEERFEYLDLKVIKDAPQIEAWINISTSLGVGVLTWENCD